MKAALILGAGLMQIPAITAAKKAGYYAVVADGNPGAVGVPEADRFEPVDLKDIEGLLKLAEGLRDAMGLAAVFTAGTDFSASVAYVAEKLGLPGHSYEAARNASDKIRMRTCFANAGVASPAFFEITEEISQLDSVSILAQSGFTGFPLVIKPCDNMGARGCRIINSLEELGPASREAVQYSRTSRAILEEYMDGMEFSIDSIVLNGELIVTGFANRHIFYPPYFIEMGHTLPVSGISSEQRNALLQTFFDGIKSLGLTTGVAKADIKLTSKGPMIGEIAARLSGGYMSGWTYPYASDCNLTDLAFSIACGTPDQSVLDCKVPTGIPGIFELPAVRTSAERAWVSIPGLVKETLGYDDAADVEGVRDVLPRVQPGDRVRFPVNNVEKCGNTIAVKAGREDAIHAAEKAVAKIVLRLQTADHDTDEFLSQPLDTVFPPSAYQLPEQVLKAIERLPEDQYISVSDSPESTAPSELLPFLDSLTDWNHRTMKASLILFNRFEKGNVQLPVRAFWKLLVRGGIQGLLYAADSVGGDLK